MIQQGHEVFALCTGSQAEGSPVLDRETSWDGVQVVYCSRELGWLPFYSSSLRKELAARMAHYEIATIRSSWTDVGPATSRACRQWHIPYLAYPEGNFDPWALRKSRAKKAVFWALFDKAFFRGASAIVALTRFEAGNIRQMGLTNRIEVIPNGIDASRFVEGATREELEEMFPRMKGRALILFMGRIHPKKGLVNLIMAFKQVHSHYRDALLVIAGPDNWGHKKQVELCIQQQSLNDHVLFTGPVIGKTKVGLLKNAAIFVLPSFSEGFPVVVPEALVCRLPIILTQNCHVPDVAEADAGIEVDTSPSSLAGAISTLLLDDHVRFQMGERAYGLAVERFNWTRVASMTIDLCQDILG